MAVPKKRTGASAQGHRRANWKGSVPETTTCKNCNAIIPTHTVCPECGFYKGKLVSIKGQAEVAPVVEEKEEKPAKKATKKSTKKAEKVEETVAETVEETKEAEVVEKVEE